MPSPTRTEPNVPPKYVDLPYWIQQTGMKKTNTYAAMKRGNILFIKVGKRTLIDFEASMEWLKSLQGKLGQAPHVRAPRAKPQGVPR